jgi:hypothetical protein
VFEVKIKVWVLGSGFRALGLRVEGLGRRNKTYGLGLEFRIEDQELRVGIRLECFRI